MCGNYSREETTVFTVSALQRQLAILAFGIVIGHGFGCSPSINLHKDRFEMSFVRPFLAIICHIYVRLSQNLDSDGHFEVLKRSYL